jgi:hypothetical protein
VHAGRQEQAAPSIPSSPACLPAIHAAAPAHLPTELRCNIKRRLWLCLWLWLSPALVPAPPLHSTPPLLPSRTPAATAMGRHPTPGAQRRHCTAWRDRVPVCPSRAAHRAPFSPALDSHSHSLLLLLHLFSPPRAGRHTERERAGTGRR